MKISQLDLDLSPAGSQSALIYDPNEQLLSKRVKRVLLSSIFGQAGANGANGLSAYEVWLSLGNVGSPTDFINSIRGAIGKSAYQVWIENGNMGNESEFLESLVGPVGPSLYQVWLDAGNMGTEQQFLATVTGPAGMDGQNGSTIFSAPGAPSAVIGIPGDYYINVTNGALYTKTSQGWGDPILSIKGTPGTIWRTGTGAPSNAIGVPNDYYLDVNNGNVYGPKGATTWGSIVGNIRGPQGNQGIQGQAGSLILTGTGAPGNGQGRINDFYLDTDNGRLYGPKPGAAWGATPALTLVLPTFNLGIKNGLNQLIFNRTLDEGLQFSGDGDTTVNLDPDDKVIVISSTTTWESLQNKPTTRNGFGLTDVYTQMEVDQLVFDYFVFENLRETPTTLSGYGILDAYTKTETDQAILASLLFENIQNTPTSLMGYGILDAYTIDETNQAILDRVTFQNLQGKPTTLLGYGITDAYTKEETDLRISAGLGALTNPLSYQGVYNADVNSPMLSDNDINVGGYLYQVIEAGIQNFGNGPIEFAVGDKVVNNGTMWEKWDMTDGVIRVNDQTGLVSLESNDIPESPFDPASMDPSNRYFTEERARLAIADSFGETDTISLYFDGAITRYVGDVKDDSITNEKLFNKSITITGLEVPLGGSISLKEMIGHSFIPITCGSQTSMVEVAQVFKFRWQGYYELSSIRASLNVAQQTGSLVTIDIKKNMVSVFSTLLTFDNMEETTKTASIPAVIAFPLIRDDDLITIEVTQIGDGTAEGLIVYFNGYAIDPPDRSVVSTYLMDSAIVTPPASNIVSTYSMDGAVEAPPVSNLVSTYSMDDAVVTPPASNLTSTYSMNDTGDTPPSGTEVSTYSMNDATLTPPEGNAVSTYNMDDQI